MEAAYLGLGGNIGDVRQTLMSAIDELRSDGSIVVSKVSRFYQTAPVGGTVGQPDFINAVVAVKTTLGPRALLDLCLSTERKFGRVRGERWSSRTLDIDLLLFGQAIIDEPELSIPHPELRKRLFVLIPLSDVAGATLQIPPDLKSLGDILSEARLDPYTQSQYVKPSV